MHDTFGRRIGRPPPPYEASAPPRYDGPDPVAAAEERLRKQFQEKQEELQARERALAKSQAEAELQVRQLSEMQQKAHEQSLALAQAQALLQAQVQEQRQETQQLLTAVQQQAEAAQQRTAETALQAVNALQERLSLGGAVPSASALSAALAPVHSDLARVEALVGSQVSETLRAMASQSQERSAFVAALADQQRAPVQMLPLSIPPPAPPAPTPPAPTPPIKVSDASAQTQDDKKKEHEALFSVLPWAGRSCRRSERFRPAPSAKRALCAPPDMALTEEEAKAFYEDNDGEPATAEQIKEAEEKLNHKLPEAYKTLLAVKNGGRPSKSCAPTKSGTSWAQDHVAIEELLAVQEIAGETADYVSEWEYPEIGLVIGSCPSGGHDLIWLDYRKCGPQGEPLVVHVDQEFDFKVTHLADDFASFVRNLKSEEEFDPEGPEKKAKTGEEGEGEEDE
ncbi:unnamed protein product [Effrenium voratum]|nr:unnamed protein product [Effrenium voratum]